MNRSSASIGRRRSTTRGRRPGLSILEVLISIGVATIGLLGALALIPLASHMAKRGLVEDDKATLGKAGASLFFIREMDKSTRWAVNWQVTTAPTDSILNPSQYPYGPAYPRLTGIVIDPQFVSRHGSTVSGTRDPVIFPYVVDPNVTDPRDLFDKAGRRLYRVTLTDRTGNAISRDLADLFFLGDDDLIVYPPADKDQPAIPGYLYSKGPDDEWGNSGSDDDGDGVTDGASEAGSAGSDDIRLKRQTLGEFSWMAMIAAAGTIDPGADGTWGAVGDDDSDGTAEQFSEFLATGSDDQLSNEFNLWILVFRNRNLDITSSPGSERVCDISQFYGGGDVRLQVLKANGGLPTDVEAKEGSWVMLTKMKPVLAVNSSSEPVVEQAQYGWYRVIRSGDLEESATAYERDVTLDGPSWDASHFINVPGTYPTQVVLCPEIVAVYQRQFRLNYETGQ